MGVKGIPLTRSFSHFSNNSFIHLHSFTLSFRDSLTPLLSHSLVRSFLDSFTPWLTDSFTTHSLLDALTP